MFALVENNQFIKIVNSNKGITIGENQYPKSIFTLWSNNEREAIGIYEVQVDNTNKKDEAYYINTNVSYSFSNGAVVGVYGTATAKPLDDVLFTQADADADEIPSDKAVGDIKQYGLKGQKIKVIKEQAGGLLAPTDWHVVKATEVASYSVPSDIATYRANVRSKSNEMETQINAVTDVDALKALYEYTEQEDGTFTRPLAEFPEEL
jgi:hypothetical protein